MDSCEGVLRQFWWNLDTDVALEVNVSIVFVEKEIPKFAHTADEQRPDLRYENHTAVS